MKVSILSLGSLALTLLSSGLVHSFPTAENFAQLARRNAGDNAAFDSEDLHKNLLRLKQKRLLFDPMTTPIDGIFSGKGQDNVVTDSRQCLGNMPSKPPTSTRATNVVLAPD